MNNLTIVKSSLELQVKGLRSVSDIECITSYFLSRTMRLATSNASMYISTSKLVDYRMILTDCRKSAFSLQIKISKTGVASISCSCAGYTLTFKIYTI